MSSVLSQLCKNLQDNTEKLEEELKKNIVDCHKLLIDKQATETKLAIEKAKDYHYKEVLDILKEIVNNIRKIIFHEGKIKQLNDESKLTSDELKRYSYVQRQVKVFSNVPEVVTRREKRRVASEISVGSLEAWEVYIKKKEEEENAVELEKEKIPKRNTKSNRRKKKFISSTFNNFLDGKGVNGTLNSISEDDQANLLNRLANIETEDEVNATNEPVNEIRNRIESDLYSTYSHASLSSIASENEDENFKNKDVGEETHCQNLSTLDIIEALDQEMYLELSDGSTKPKIVDVIYKKK